MCALLLMMLLVARTVADDEPPLRCRDPRCRHIGSSRPQEHQFDVDGNELWLKYRESDGYLRIKCNETSILESPAMPRADPALSVWELVVERCQLPAGSLAGKLAELNVTMLFTERNVTLTIERLPPATVLSAKHFSSLERLVSLNISADAAAPTRAESGFLSQLQNLRSITLQYVTLSADELDAPRPLLQSLTLNHTGIERVPEAVYSSSSLLYLTIESRSALDAVEMPPKLCSLKLRSSETTLRIDAVPSLEELDVTSWSELQPPPLTRCDRLRKLYLTAPAVRTLPKDWLINCTKLQEVVFQNARNLNTLPHGLFWRYNYVVKLVAFKEGALETLAENQFEGLHALATLELNGNRLRMISSSTFPSVVQTFDLSSNDLDSGVMETLRYATLHIYMLNLSNNPRLGDVCNEKGYSRLRWARSLRRLLLNKTNVSRICQDWREDLPYLEELDLRDTSITTLSFKDLQFTRAVRAEVLLQGAVVYLNMTRDDFNAAKRTPTSGAFIELDALECDCRMYWTRRTLDSFPHALDRISELRCVGGGLLSERLPEDMLCVEPEECRAVAGLPDGCTCAVRPDDSPDLDRQLVRVSCEQAAMGSMPRLPASEGRLYELRLANNLITSLHASELHHVKGLDLRNNSISRVDEETATKLSRLEGMLQLAGNPLECDCSAAPLLQALHSRVANTDLDSATCSGGAALSAAPVANCSPPVAGLVGGLAAFFAISIAIIIYLTSRERRFFLKAVLHRWGCRCCIEADVDERRYDAFITFSHKDEAVVRELVARLEPSYQLCLHYRDWTPGLRIPDQIVESVQESRRTVALVSRHFLASTWTRVEFREAHEAAMVDARPRLVVVFLEDPAELTLDERLQRYVATHTYLRWGDPWFWDKMAVALPRPREPPAEADPTSPSTFNAVAANSRTAIELTPRI